MNSQRFKLTALTALSALAALALVQVSETARATSPSSGWGALGSETTKSFFERIRVSTCPDDDAVCPFRVKILAKDPADVFQVKTVVLPGNDSGWHSHPGPSVVLVKQGTATIYESDDPTCSGVTYPAGSGFIDKGGSHVHLVQNASPTDTLVVVAFQIVPHNVARRIDQPRPPQCPSSVGINSN